jgi:hypothetical protein
MDFVQLDWKRNRGWPWPEDSWGLDSMYGPDGWCHACGIPLREQPTRSSQYASMGNPGSHTPHCGQAAPALPVLVTAATPELLEGRSVHLPNMGTMQPHVFAGDRTVGFWGGKRRTPTGPRQGLRTSESVGSSPRRIRFADRSGWLKCCLPRTSRVENSATCTSLRMTIPRGESED